MAKVWEIVEKRGDGYFYTNMRTANPDEGVLYHSWVLAHDRTRYVFRECESSQPPLSTSMNAFVQVDPSFVTARKAAVKMIDESKARRIGFELITALCALFVLQPTRDGGAQYALGRSLAAMTGEFDNADIRDAFIQGVMEGFKQAPAQIAAPAPRPGVVDGNS